MKNIWARSAFAQGKECCRYVDNTSNNPVVCWTEVFRMWTRSRCILYKTIYRRQKLSEMILVINRSNYGFAFVRLVNRSYDYRQNWTLLGPIAIINRICDQNHSIADYVRNRRGKVTNNLNGSGQYNWSTWSNIDRLYETVYFRKLSLFRYKLWVDTSTSRHTCKFINNAQFTLLFFIPCDFWLDDLITYNYFGHLEYLTFCFACRLFIRILSLHPFFNSTAVQKSSKLQKRRKQKPRKGICSEVKSIELRDEKVTLKCFFWRCKPQGKFILETIEDGGPPSAVSRK